MLAFAVAGGVVMIKNEETPADRLIVDVTGTQYLWSFQYPDGQVADEMVLPVDTVVLCAGQESVRGLADDLAARGVRAHVIGGADVASELDAKRAIRQGTEVAARL